MYCARKLELKYKMCKKNVAISKQNKKHGKQLHTFIVYDCDGWDRVLLLFYIKNVSERDSWKITITT